MYLITEKDVREALKGEPLPFSDGWYILDRSTLDTYLGELHLVAVYTINGKVSGIAWSDRPCVVFKQELDEAGPGTWYYGDATNNLLYLVDHFRNRGNKQFSVEDLIREQFWHMNEFRQQEEHIRSIQQEQSKKHEMYLESAHQALAD